MSSRQETGQAAEQAAHDHLLRHGFRLIVRNFRCRTGEIDLIMAQGDLLTFVEVRYRSRPDYGGALQSVTHAKQRKIIAAARYFLLNHPRFSQHAIRFDVIAVHRIREEWRLEWIPAAFLAE